MDEKTDLELLRSYARNRSEPAFTELVRRHIDLVHSAALRMVRDSHLAEEVTQSVFLALARDAERLADRPVLASWLHRTARNIAAQTVRTDVRRRNREQKAAAMNEILAAESGAPCPWDTMALHLDAALNELSEADRDALLLRFFERKSAREIATVLSVSDEAAQKRVTRAVERLREVFVKRGITVGAGTLAGLISANAVQSAPVALTAQVAAGAFTTAALTTTAKVIAMTTLQKALVGTTLIAAIGTGIFEAHRASRLHEENQALKRQQTPLAAQILQLQQERNDATNQLAVVRSRLAAMPRNKTELLKLRGETTQLQQDSTELARLKGAQKDKSAAQADFMNFVVAQMGSSMTNAALHNLKAMKETLGLSADQEQQIRNLLMSSVETQVQASLGSINGKPTDESRKQLAQLRADEKSQMIALLTPEQQVAYQNLQDQQAADATQAFAKREASAMQNELQLSDEQTHTVISILASLPAGKGGIADASAPDAKEQLDFRLQALAQTLAPDQLAAYQQSKLTEIEQASKALQMFKSFGQ